MEDNFFINKKIAIVHDYLYTYGGAERVLEVFHEIFPYAQVYTSYFLPNKFPESFTSWGIKETWLGKTALKNTPLRKYFTLLCPFALKSLDLSTYDIVISSCTGPSKGVNTKKNCMHISYIYSPPWLEWNIIKPNTIFKTIYLRISRWWDFKAAQKPQYLIAISGIIKKRIKQFYKRESVVIYPPVDINKIIFQLDSQIIKEDYFIMCGRLEIYKGVSIVAKILDRNNLKLKIIGTGADQKNLFGLSKNIESLGFINDEQKFRELSKAKALIMWNEEDFGINMVEAIACGTPVIAFNKGGSQDIIKDGVNGVFFNTQDEKDLLQAIQRIKNITVDKSILINSIKSFSCEEFKKNILKYIKSTYL